MLDLWEIMGRLATDDQFRRAVFNSNFQPTYYQDVDAAKNPNHRVKIPPEDYKNMRAVASLRVDGPISLMALGEILFAMTDARFKKAVSDLADTLAELFAKLDEPLDPSTRGTDFFQALGVLLIDLNLQQDFVDDPTSIHQFALDALLGDDLDAVHQVLSQLPSEGAPTPRVFLCCQDLCQGSWVPDCNALLAEWDTQVAPASGAVLKHTHPVSNIP
jgi:hypothetical protein